MRDKERVVVVGAGISGLSCAYRLKQLGIRALVLEEKERPGGLIASVRKDSRLFELGPQFPRFPSSVWQLVRALRLEHEFLAGDSRANRYILKDERLHAAPLSLAPLLSTRLLGFTSKFRILSEIIRYSRPPREEETLAEFVERKFGAEVLDNLVDPFVSTIFFGDCYKMGMESAFPMLVNWERENGSVIRGALRARRRKVSDDSVRSPANPGRNQNQNMSRVTDTLPTLGSFRSGMATLPERLARELDPGVKYRRAVAGIARAPDEKGQSTNHWQIRLTTGENIEAEQVVLAVPAFVAAALLQDSVPQLSSLLKSIEYAPLRVASFVYERSQVRHSLNGFGFMVPRREGLNTICTFWNSSLFPCRCGEREVLLTSFVRKLTGHGSSAAADEDWMFAVQSENSKTLGITGQPVDNVRWASPTALPQYNVGHVRRITEINSRLSSVPNLCLTGNFLRGRSIGDCVEVAFSLAEELHSRLRADPISPG